MTISEFDWTAPVQSNRIRYESTLMRETIIWLMLQFSLYGGGTDIYYVGTESLCRMAYRHDPVKVWIKSVFLAIRSNHFSSFKMLPSITYLYVLLIFVTRIMHGQSLCSCKYEFFTYFYKRRKYILILCAYSLGNQTDLDFATGVNLLYYKWFVSTVKSPNNN